MVEESRIEESAILVGFPAGQLRRSPLIYIFLKSERVGNS